MSGTNEIIRNGAVRSIAIVGCGPRGMYALDSLCQLAGKMPAKCRFDVTVYEPAEHPGAGAIYNHDQPDYLRMNFASRHIDAWNRGWVADSPQHPSFLTWMQQQYAGQPDPDGFVSRNRVGRYLSACFSRIVQACPANVDIRLRRARVEHIEHQPHGWQVRSTQETRHFEQVLITTGHQDWQRRSPGSHDDSQRRFIPSIFPVEEKLSTKQVPSNQVAGIKGFALTFIDASLALTLGRDGRFIETADGYAYRALGKEPARLVPLSRTGRPLLCKPDHGKFVGPAVETIWRDASAALNGLPKHSGAICFESQIWPIILRAAESAANLEEGAAGRWFDQWCDGNFDGKRALQAMRSSFQVATGRRPPDLVWAMGEAWRKIYPALVKCVSHGGLNAQSQRPFKDIAREMERISFGPPAINMGYMLALADAGILDLSRCDHFADKSAGQWPGDIDVAIDATIPAPDIFDPQGPIGGLEKAGYLNCGRNGEIVINRSGQALTEGRAVPGLSVIGRATEGCVLGNDTLSRTLHDHIRHWAETIVGSPPLPASFECPRELEMHA